MMVTNSITPIPVTILSVHPSCGCTTAELPPVPWTISPGSNGLIKVSVNLAGKNGMLFKTVNVATDRGSKTLTLRINILPAPVPIMTDADRIRAQAIAKVDRQAVFKNDCAVCHAKPGNGKYGKTLFDAVCSVCHESQNRASMVPDLHALKIPTNEDFWRTWITTATRFAHAGVFNRRRRSAQRHADCLARRLSECGHPVKSSAAAAMIPRQLAGLLAAGKSIVVALAFAGKLSLPFIS